MNDFFKHIYGIEDKEICPIVLRTLSSENETLYHIEYDSEIYQALDRGHGHFLISNGKHLFISVSGKFDLEAFKRVINKAVYNEN